MAQGRLSRAHNCDVISIKSMTYLAPGEDIHQLRRHEFEHPLDQGGDIDLSTLFQTGRQRHSSSNWRSENRCDLVMTTESGSGNKNARSQRYGRKNENNDWNLAFVNQ